MTMSDFEELCRVTTAKGKAIDLILDYGGIDGAHHKQWIIDQVLRLLAGVEYEDIIFNWQLGDDGEDTYEWDRGIAP